MAEPINFSTYRVDVAAAKRRESLKEYAEFCRLQRARLAKRFSRSVAVIRDARRIAVREQESEPDAEWELLASRKG